MSEKSQSAELRAIVEEMRAEVGEGTGVGFTGIDFEDVLDWADRLSRLAEQGTRVDEDVINALRDYWSDDHCCYDSDIANEDNDTDGEGDNCDCRAHRAFRALQLHDTLKRPGGELCLECARIAYVTGHNDTVEARYGDPEETARDIVDDVHGDVTDSQGTVPAEVWVACAPNDYRYATMEYGDTKEEALRNLKNEMDGEEIGAVQYLQIPVHGAPAKQEDHAPPHKPIPDCGCGHLWAEHFPGGGPCEECDCAGYHHPAKQEECDVRLRDSLDIAHRTIENYREAAEVVHDSIGHLLGGHTYGLRDALESAFNTLDEVIRGGAGPGWYELQAERTEVEKQKDRAEAAEKRAHHLQARADSAERHMEAASKARDKAIAERRKARSERDALQAQLDAQDAICERLEGERDALQERVRHILQDFPVTVKDILSPARPEPAATDLPKCPECGKTPVHRASNCVQHRCSKGERVHEYTVDDWIRHVAERTPCRGCEKMPHVGNRTGLLWCHGCRPRMKYNPAEWLKRNSRGEREDDCPDRTPRTPCDKCSDVARDDLARAKRLLRYGDDAAKAANTLGTAGYALDAVTAIISHGEHERERLDRVLGLYNDLRAELALVKRGQG